MPQNSTATIEHDGLERSITRPDDGAGGLSILKSIVIHFAIMHARKG